MPDRSGVRPRVVHQNLDTAYVSLAALVRHLQQRDFEGRVHVELDEYDADIFLGARERPRVRERDHVTGREAEGEAALQRVFVRASEPGGRVSVFEGDFEAAEAGEHRAAAAAILANSTIANTETAARTQDEIDRRNVLQLSGELIASVERALVASGGGEFAARFRAARGGLREQYPFLSSLSSCVEYEGGESRLARGADVVSFVAGVCEALRRVVERAAIEDGGARPVRREVARELAALGERRPRALARFNFTPQLERIAGIRWT
ncbi:MAG: hypothetical protein LC785_02160 [Acidobacteria bacterium]|nr:hypothetical protein [Acidobacteriota bacterium]MCA1640790.1 hypothetical protein [Acidobacteriota bacterium]